MITSLAHWMTTVNSELAVAFLLLGLFIHQPANSIIPIVEGCGLAVSIRWLPSMLGEASTEVCGIVALLLCVWATAFLLMVGRSLAGTGPSWFSWNGWESFSVLEVLSRRKGE